MLCKKMKPSPRLIALFATVVSLLSFSCSRAREETTESVPKNGELSAHRTDGKGRAVVIPDTPVRASSWGSWKVLFFPGEEGIATSGGIVFQVSPFWGWSQPQTVAPEAAGYTTVVSSNVDVRFDVMEGDPHYLLIVLAEGHLTARDTVTITYGDTLRGKSHESLARVDRYAERGEEFFIKVDGNGDSFFTPIEASPAIDIVARDAVTLVAYAPSVVTVGQEFTLRVSALDETANRDTGFRGTVEIRTPSGALRLPERYTFSPEDKGSARIPAIAIEAGVHSIEVKSVDGDLHALSNPILCVAERPEYSLFWSDLHGHSGLSDGSAQPDEFYSYARDVAGLDACALTDHDAHGVLPIDENPKLWDLIRETTESFYEPGKFVTFLGYEWTNWTFGHRNILFPGTEGTAYSFRDSTSDTPEELYALLEPLGAIVIAHHPAGGPVHIDWEHHDDSAEPLVEICSVHGNSDYYGCPGQIYRPEKGAFVQDALERGYRMGILASGDTHDGHPGLRGPDYPSMGIAGIWAKVLTRRGIWEALTAKRLYGTSGARIILEFEVDGHRMGESFRLLGEREGTIRVSALGTDAIDLVEILENAVVIRREEPGSAKVEFLHRHSLKPGAYYRVRLVQRDGEMAWSSPVWCTAG
jgi:hypothetical protein